MPGFPFELGYPNKLMADEARISPGIAGPGGGHVLLVVANQSVVGAGGGLVRSWSEGS